MSRNVGECRKCWRDSVYRVKTVGGEYEVETCSHHLPQMINEGLGQSVAQQGRRVQVTEA